MLWPRSWDRGPTVDSLGDLVKNHEYDEDAVLWCVADSFKTAFLSNRKELNKKATAINIAIMAVALEAGGLIFVGVLLFVAIGLHQGSSLANAEIGGLFPNCGLHVYLAA